MSNDDIALISLNSNLKIFKGRLKESGEMYDKLKDKSTPYAKQIFEMTIYYQRLIEVTESEISGQGWRY